MKLLLLWCVVVKSAYCARILAVLPLAAKSHHAFFQPILTTLAHRGHNVTVYGPFPQQIPIPNYMDVPLKTPLVDVSKLDNAFWRFLEAPQTGLDRTIWDVAYPTCVDTLSQEPIINLMESEEKFDLVITQALVGQEVMLAFGHKFQAPTITLQPKGACTIDNRVAGNSLSISYIPDVGLPYSNFMSFTECLFNAYSKLSVLFHYYFYHIPRQEALMRQHFKDPSLPPIIDMVSNISLIFTLGHTTAFYAQPSTPNIVPLGGIHIDIDRKPIPQDIKKFLDEAKHGVIYFSLGTYIPDHMMGQEYFQNYINVFKKLPQRILWKSRIEHIEGLPDNVMIGRWMPQQHILAHPKCVLFITHGGLLSQHETMHFGIPVVCVPYFADQPMNARFYQEAGMGVILDYRQLTQHAIHRAITTVIGNPRYAENAKRVSQIFNDPPLSPRESVVFWTEYVLRHHGAAHLRPASARLPWYQLIMLDILAVILTMVIAVPLLLHFVISRIYYFIVKRQKNSEHKTKIKRS